MALPANDNLPHLSLDQISARRAYLEHLAAWAIDNLDRLDAVQEDLEGDEPEDDSEANIVPVVGRPYGIA